MTLDELQSHRLFLAQTEKKRNWILAVIKYGGDLTAATRETHPEAKQPASLGRQLAADPEVEELLNIFYGETDEPSIEDYRKRLLKWMQEAKSDAAKAAYSQQYIELRGWKKSTPATPNNDKSLEGLI